ncbi:hypothetical protein [Dyella subtropica]|uniref:hypothetical protein n=1 Tax=Dyella subtropica TaxID=2992127 RepID=UPI00224D5768|nr:hypothetical protein [Dyella subtropica]
MYALNQTNSLYFYPHKLSFGPFLKAAGSGQHNHRFPEDDASATWPRASTSSQHGPPMPKVDSPKQLEKNLQDLEAHRMDDDGARHSRIESSER